MGKKNKGKYDKLGYLGKREADKKMAKKYGIDLSEYGNGGRPGQTSGKKSYDQLKKDVSRAAANDYDVRRSVELAQEAGNKKAKKLGKGISNAGQAYAATRFMEKTHKKRIGAGGNYDGANDEGNVMDYWKNKVMDQRAAASAPMDDTTAKTIEEVTTEPDPVTFSKEYAQSRAGEDAYKDFTAAGGYSALMRGEKGMAESFRQQRTDNVKEYLKPDPVSQAGAGIDEQGDFRMKREFTNQRKAGQIFS